MARSRQGSKKGAVRKLTRTGTYTYYVTIPKPLIDELGWREHQQLVVNRSGEKLVVQNSK